MFAVYELRFTPTCVGTASSSMTSASGSAVHPHMRGDGVLCHPCHAALHGSPPHAWGRPDRCPAADGRRRFTPTCVGTACTGREAHSPLAVHPHMRGDGTGIDVLGWDFAGSPPHAWGRRQRPGRARAVRRFTPTCVGTALAAPSCRATHPVHPHMRGDGRHTPPQGEKGGGSPPHAWGRRLSAAGVPVLVRFTPTCVGTAVRCFCVIVPPTVHPHMRGDGHFDTSVFGGVVGSPPHAWGRRPWRTRPRSRTSVHPHMRGDGTGVRFV